MLDFIRLCANKFEVNHGLKPNILYLNQAHLSQIQTDSAIFGEFSQLLEQSEINLVVSQSIIHPVVSHIPDRGKETRQVKSRKLAKAA